MNKWKNQSAQTDHLSLSLSLSEKDLVDLQICVKVNYSFINGHLFFINTLLYLDDVFFCKMFPDNLLPVLLAMHGFVYALLEVKSRMYFLWMSLDSPPSTPSAPPLPPPCQAENKDSQLHMSPDVSDKVRAGFFCWFDVHFKQPTSQLCCWFAMEIRRFLFCFCFFFIILCFGSKTECQVSDKFVFV